MARLFDKFNRFATNQIFYEFFTTGRNLKGLAFYGTVI